MIVLLQLLKRYAAVKTWYVFAVVAVAASTDPPLQLVLFSSCCCCGRGVRASLVADAPVAVSIMRVRLLLLRLLLRLSE